MPGTGYPGSTAHSALRRVPHHSGRVSGVSGHTAALAFIEGDASAAGEAISVGGLAADAVTSQGSKVGEQAAERLCAGARRAWTSDVIVARAGLGTSRKQAWAGRTSPFPRPPSGRAASSRPV
jgi:hypothetical protein